nr:YidC/Oxa1 family membrane protein insertase [Clostridiales bacterium]
MSIGTIIYRILIGPLELLFEVVFVVANRMVENPAYAIIFLSLAMNVLVLPLYRRADELQAEERDKENALRPWVTHIKKTFSGDERFMMLQAFYRQNGYKPTDTLKGSISLLLEIPFFIAAYHFLSHLTTIQGVPFGPIADLGAPDALLAVGGLTINILPILMTLINFVSAAIYMKGFPLKSKIQMYGVAVIFLVFLYRSPAGLVFYWTLNNLFSLCKNIFYKIKNPAKVLRIMLSIMGVLLLLGLYLVYPMHSIRTQAIMTVVLLMMQAPMISHLFKKSGREIRLPEQKYTKPVFWFSCGVLTVLTGLLVPSAIIHGSAAEFINIYSYSSPLWYVVSAFVIAVGTFLVWCGIFFNLAGDDGKQIMSLFAAMAAVSAVVDYMFFGKSFGNISPDLIYDMTPHVTRQMILVNFAALAVVAAVVLLLYMKKRALISLLLAVSCIALISMAGMNILGIRQELKDTDKIIAAAMNAEPAVNLSKSGKNVIVIMMDRQIGQFVPYLVHEKPELKKQFDGFVLYSNSVSFGNKTNFGSPALYGGYDYTPEKLNERDTESLESKHNEALKVMPAIFGDAGYDVTICEPTYAGYAWIPDLTVFDDHPEYHCFLANQQFDLEEYGYTLDPTVIQSKRL